MFNQSSSLVILTEQQQPITTSIIVSEAFEKQHKNVLQSIERIECSEEFRRLNFQPASYMDEQGKPRPAYNITRDGFTFLAMGFTGSKAAQFKEAFIAQFNKMEQMLLNDSGPVKRYEFNHHRGTNAPGGLDMKYTLAMADTLKDIPPIPRLIALGELTGIDLSKAIAHLAPTVNRAQEQDEAFLCLDLLLETDAEVWPDLDYGFDEQDFRYFEGDPLDVGHALNKTAEAAGFDTLLDNTARFKLRLRDKASLKKHGWRREEQGFVGWGKTVRYTKIQEVAS